MAAKRKPAEETPETASETPNAGSGPQRQPGEDAPEPPKRYAPDPFPLDTDRLAGTRLLGCGQYFNKDLGKYAFRKLQIQFDEKPPEPILEMVRNAGFSRNFKEKVWEIVIPEDRPKEARGAAEDLFKEVSQLLREAKGLGQTKTPFQPILRSHPSRGSQRRDAAFLSHFLRVARAGP